MSLTSYSPPTKCWGQDHAPGSLLVEEAGRIISDLHGCLLNFGHGCMLGENFGVVVARKGSMPRLFRLFRLC
jgi:3'-phosphoadenosine 5'-phosphosulfate (PAPS) 3'-phosphatase